MRLGPAGRKRLKARAARGSGVPASPRWLAGCGLLEVTGPLGLGPAARRAGADARALPGPGVEGARRRGPSVECVCGRGAGHGAAPARRLFFSSQ